MRERTRAREEHPEGEERRRSNGRARSSGVTLPPRRRSHHVAPRPPKRPRGRVARGFARLIGLLATAVLLAVGVTVVLMVTREDGGTEPPETFAAPNPTPAPKKKVATRPKAGDGPILAQVVISRALHDRGEGASRHQIATQPNTNTQGRI